MSMARGAHSTPNRPVVGFRSTSFRARSPDSDRSRRSRWSERSRSRSPSRRPRSRTETSCRVSRERYSSKDAEERHQEIQPIQRSVEGSHRGEDPHVPPSESAGRDPNVADLPGNGSSLSCLEPRSAIPSCLAYQDMEHRVEHDAPRPVADVGESLERKRKRHHHKHKKSRDNGRQTEVGSRARTERSGTVASSDPPEPPISVDLPVIVEPKTMEINKGASASLEKPSSGSIPVTKDSPRRAVEHATSLQLKNASSIGSGTPAADNEGGERSSPKRWPTLTGGTHGKEQLKIQSTPGRAISCGLPKSKKVTVPRATKIMGPKTKVGRPEGKETSVSKVTVCIPQADSLLAEQTLEANQALEAVRSRLQKQNARTWAVVAELEAEERRREAQLHRVIQEAETNLRRLKELASPKKDDMK